MIKSKRELKKFVKEEIYKATGVKANVEYSGVLRINGKGSYLSFEIDCPSLNYYLKNKWIGFPMGLAKKDYFEEGFALNKEDVLKEIQDTIIEIKEVLSEA